MLILSVATVYTSLSEPLKVIIEGNHYCKWNFIVEYIVILEITEVEQTQLDVLLLFGIRWKVEKSLFATVINNIASGWYYWRTIIFIKTKIARWLTEIHEHLNSSIWNSNIICQLNFYFNGLIYIHMYIGTPLNFLQFYSSASV